MTSTTYLNTVANLRKSLAKSLCLLGACLALLFAASSTASAVISPTSYPPASTFYWGNTAVSTFGATAFVSGSGYGFRYLLPPSYNSSNKYPVIIFLHGLGQVGSDDAIQITQGIYFDSNGNSDGSGALNLVSTANPDNRDAYPCFFIAPQTPTSSWSDATSAANIQQMINNFAAHYGSSFDTSRIYLTGLSLGGEGTWDMPVQIMNANSGHNIFAALAPQSGTVTLPNTTSPDVTKVPNVPIWVFHGVQDTTRPISFLGGDDSNVSTLRGLGYSVIFSRYTLGYHNIWPTAYQHPLLLPWLFSQRLGQPAQSISGLAVTGTAEGTTMALSGTAASSSSFSFSRVGWSTNPAIVPPYPWAGYDGVANGTTTFTSATASFTAANQVNERISMKSSPATTFFTILGVPNSTTLTVDTTAGMVSSPGLAYALYPYGTDPNPYPASTISPTWSLSGIPLVSGTNYVGVIAEAPNNVVSYVGSYYGLTTVNLPYSISYTTHTGDVTPPSVAIKSPTTSPTYTATSSPFTLGGTASDNVAVTAMTWTNVSASGTTNGTPSLVSGAWTASGITLATGSNEIMITAKDAAGNISSASINVNYQPGTSTPPSISGTPPAATAGVAYSYTFTSGGTPSPTFSLTGSLPAGLTLNTLTGTISGTTTVVGSVSGLVVTATNGVSPNATDTFTFTVNPTVPTITGTPPSGTAGSSYGPFSFTFGGYPAPTLSLAPALPSGLSFNATTGTISGTPAAAGTYSGTVTATNTAGNGHDTFSITISSSGGGGAVVLPIKGVGLVSGSGGSATYISGMVDGQPTSVPTVGNTTASFGNSYTTPIGGTPPNEYYVDFGTSYSTETITAIYVGLSGYVDGNAMTCTYWWASTPDLSYSMAAGDVPEPTDLKLYTTAGYTGNSSKQWIEPFSGSLTPAHEYLVIQITGGTATNGTQEAVFVGTTAPKVIPLSVGLVSGSGGSATYISGMVDGQPTSVPTVGNTTASFGNSYTTPIGGTPPNEYYVDFGTSYSTETITAIYVGLSGYVDGNAMTCTYWWASTPDLSYSMAAGDVPEPTDLKLYTTAGYTGNSSKQWIEPFSGSLTPAHEYLVIQITGGTATNGTQEAVFVGR